MKKSIKAIANLINVNDEVYKQYSERFQAKTLTNRLMYIIAYLLPGVLAYLIVNIKTVHDFLSTTLGFEGYNFQYFIFLVFTFGWHIGLPLYMLKGRQKMTWHEVFDFLSLNRFSVKEVFIVAPIAFVLSVILSLPYMMFVYEPFQAWLNSIPAFQIPAHSIFGSYEAFYGASTFVLVLMLVGNFIGEEIYFRGYLMKKTAFLGKYNWLMNSLLFCIYHVWQIPQSLPLIVPFLFFGLVMQLRKNLYTLFIFHLLFNLAGVQIYNVLLGLGN